MRLLPKTSFYRTFILLFSIVIITQALTVGLSAYFLYVPALKTLAYSVADQWEASSGNLARASSLSNSTGSENPQKPLLMYRLVSAEEKQGNQWLGDLALLDFSLPALSEHRSDTGIIDAQLRLEGGMQMYLRYSKIAPQWLQVPVNEFSQIKLWMVMVWLIGNPLLVIVATLFSVRQIALPLRKLKQAALRISRGDIESLELYKGASEEVSAVNGAFNTMAASLRRATTDRALLLAGVSHDLRTPLTRMRLSAELLKQDDPDLIAGVVADIEDMDVILDQFISFIRDGSDEVAELGDVNQLIVECIKPLNNPQQTIVTQLQSLPDIYFKRLAFKRMLSNLVNNAFVHGGSLVEVTSHAKDQEITISILDNGPGIPEDKISQLFTPFARGDKSRSTAGSGLGLAIVHRIVSMHHGRIELKNRLQGGLAAIVLLPMSGQLVAPEPLSKGVR